MNANNNIPGFTAENAILKTVTPYRTVGVFDSPSRPALSRPAYVQPAAIDSCTNLAIAFLNAPVDSFQEKVFIGAYFRAGCGEG